MKFVGKVVLTLPPPQMEGYFYVYRLFYNYEIVYIGFSKNPRQRIGEHLLKKEWYFDSFDYMIFEDEGLSRRAEIALITVYAPIYNRTKDDRSFISKEMVELLALKDSEISHLEVIEFREPRPEKMSELVTLLQDDDTL